MFQRKVKKLSVFFKINYCMMFPVVFIGDLINGDTLTEATTRFFSALK